MKNIRKILIAGIVFMMLTGVTHAGLGSDMIDTLGIYALQGIGSFISVLLGFMAGMITFGILFFTTLLDLVFIKVPYIGDLIGVAGDAVYIETVQTMTTIVLIFSIAMWLILGGVSYIKDVIDRLTYGMQAGNKWNLFRDLGGKLLVILLIFSIPVSLPLLFKGVNSLSAGIISMETMKFSDEDRIQIQSKPMTTMVELGLGLPAGDFVTADYEESQRDNVDSTSIYNKKEGEGIVNGEINFSLIADSIINKSIFQYTRFSNLSSSIMDKEQDTAVIKNPGKTETVFDDLLAGSVNGIVKFLFIAIMYIVFLYIVFMKLFAIVMSLVTRFINILMTSMYLSFHIAMLGSENTKGFGTKNIWSFIGDILVTPLIAAYAGISILILGFFASVIGSGSEGILYFGEGAGANDYLTIMFKGMLIMIILWGMLNKLHKLIEYVGANFETIISTKGGQGMQDSYSNPGEAMNASSKVFSLAKTTGAALGGGVALRGAMSGARNVGGTVASGLKSKISNKLYNSDHNNMVSKATDSVNFDKMKATIKRGNNTKIQKK